MPNEQFILKLVKRLLNLRLNRFYQNTILWSVFINSKLSSNRQSVLEGKTQGEKTAERTYGTRACFFDEATQPPGTLCLLGKKKEDAKPHPP